MGEQLESCFDCTCSLVNSTFSLLQDVVPHGRSDAAWHSSVFVEGAGLNTPGMTVDQQNSELTRNPHCIASAQLVRGCISFDS